MENRTYLVTEAEKLTGEKAHVLRYWEDELGMEIHRNSLGHRCYTAQDIQIFLGIRELKKKGLHLKAIRELMPKLVQATAEIKAFPAEAAETAKEKPDPAIPGKADEVPEGTLFIDDHDVNTVSIHSVREGCAYVPQDNFLFSDTISGNISFAFDDENQEAIEDAAMMSDVHDNIAEFKEGYRTVLGERGVTVSGGQKQRISIARALMKHAPILILDDSVSAVDTKTERTILDNLKKREGLTTILIAHRISTVEQMDKIVFVEDGEVHAVGKHEDLYRTCTAYRKMVDLQKLEEEAGEE